MARIINIEATKESYFIKYESGTCRKYTELPKTALEWLKTNTLEEEVVADEETPVAINETPVASEEAPQNVEADEAEETTTEENKEEERPVIIPPLNPNPPCPVVVRSCGSPTQNEDEAAAPDHRQKHPWKEIAGRVLGDSIALVQIIGYQLIFLWWHIEDLLKVVMAFLVAFGIWWKNGTTARRKARARAGVMLEWVGNQAFGYAALVALVFIRLGGALLDMALEGWALREEIVAEAKAA